MNQFQDDPMDFLLKKALSSEFSPEEALNQKVKMSMKEKWVMKKERKRSFLRVAVIAATLVVLMSVTALAVWRLLPADKYAESLGFPALAEAFRSKDATRINQSIDSNGFRITLLGITSGKGLTSVAENGNIQAEKSYAVVAIEKLGGKMPRTTDANYGEVPFFVTPLIKGLIPWQVNIASIGDGGYVESVVDGVMYRLIECDSVEMFADRGVYLAVISSRLYDTKAFTYNFDSGEITRNTQYKGVNEIFDFPLDKSKADPEKAKRLLNSIYGDYDKFQKEELPNIREEYQKFTNKE